MIRYAVKMPQSRDGVFAFLTSTQAHCTKSLKGAKREVEKMLDPLNADFQVGTKTGWRNPTRKELIDEMGGMPKVFKLTIEEVE